MSATAIERRPPAESVALFNGATPDEVIAAASAIATRFSDVVKQQRLSKRIGDRDHILIEAWQTIGSLTGVFATEDGGVRQLDWPAIDSLGPEPDRPGPEPRNRNSPEYDAWKEAAEPHRAWAHHAALLQARSVGKAFGFSAAFEVTNKDGRKIGWGEGRVDRSERTWVSREDYALSSMAQTRGQSRALGAPLRFIVKLAGYEPTLPDDMPDDRAPAEPVAPHGPVTDKDEDLDVAIQAVKVIGGDLDVNAADFVVRMGEHFNGVPVAGITMLRGLANFIGDARAAQSPQPEQEA